MKKICIISLLLIATISVFSQKFFEQSNMSPKFDMSKSYRLAILPLSSPNMELMKQATIGYNKITNELMVCSKFQILNKSQVEQSVNKLGFGVSGLSPNSYPELAKELNADLLMLCELSNEKQVIKKKEVGTVTANIQIFDMKNEAIVIYSGKARAINPISADAETEFAIQKALTKLTKSCSK